MSVYAKQSVKLRVGSRRQPDTGLAALTAREIEVLRLMADGITSRGIAAELHVTFKTAVCHRTHVLEKLCVNNSVLAVRLAIREGLIAP